MRQNCSPRDILRGIGITNDWDGIRFMANSIARRLRAVHELRDIRRYADNDHM